jgi:hypothetical protein
MRPLYTVWFRVNGHTYPMAAMSKNFVLAAVVDLEAAGLMVLRLTDGNTATINLEEMED